ncbi:hypothetical protein PRUB_b0334 [Pseudoalteromonas rubra]|uniref:Uncharacterized protein n=1 Tax=Pseudoalteromonas rubra TaxID=43658 RepID=A0A8T0BZA9_9GAMM|nr:hypothetical protein [Pseudoalteromonas rubra]KAF7781190.1 hypothetical protein PRUB_b0334 [Pseudoalteromonas rubra]
MTSEVLAALDKLVVDKKLESKALEGARQWAASSDFDIENAKTSQFVYELYACNLCFKHEFRAAPYIEVVLNITFDDNDVGYYCWVTDITGEVIDDRMVITDETL